MRFLVRILITNIFALWVTARVLEGVSYTNYETLVLAAAVLGGVNLLVRPLAKLVALPLNVLTLGAFSWLINVLMLYLVTRLVPGFEVAPFFFEGFTYRGFTAPALDISLFWALFLASFLVALVTSLISWIFD